MDYDSTALPLSYSAALPVAGATSPIRGRRRGSSRIRAAEGALDPAAAQHARAQIEDARLAGRNARLRRGVEHEDISWWLRRQLEDLAALTG